MIQLIAIMINGAVYTVRINTQIANT
jgi:hypothetical protein